MASTATSGAKDDGDCAEHCLDLRAQDEARRHRRRGDEVGRILAGDREPGEPAGKLPGRHDQHRHDELQRAVALIEAAPQHQRRRDQIKHLHERLRHQPWIAAQQDPFLAAQRAARRSFSAKGVSPRMHRRWNGRRLRRRWRIRRTAAQQTRRRRQAAPSLRPARRKAETISPSAARAGHHNMLSACRAPAPSSVLDCNTAAREIVP